MAMCVLQKGQIYSDTLNINAHLFGKNLFFPGFSS